ncbi:trypsin-like peptidase domain-containing protein [Noviherbaspirillum sp.]|uniref:trypsin-like peptidase domain-containing protein n=1 Tax=Noviherbaspirillum sp. TaxID=1926288 RepID=UPI002B485CD5|nr:trypsin-like peptidase domain-containing protein [Noviherbaspirillum sp.]HJV81079.1 trypsin-like peptidase domain-containing protein [Noviherbaspirillum sp.]
MVPSNILQRTFHISHNGALGTGFTIDVAGRQYLATAKHVVEGLSPDSSIAVLRNGAWQNVEVADVWHSPTGADLSLLSLKKQLSPTHPIHVLGDSSSYFLSQQIYFLGFPYGMHMEAGLINDGYPVPFVKTGIVSSFSSVSGGSQLIYCDGHNNPGFSGGPIVTVSAKQEVTVIAVVSAYRFNEDPVLLNGVDTGLTYRANTGLVIGYGAKELLVQATDANSGAVIA